ncbi:ArsR/SmtB family transcription factor [Paraflavisolibacter sp. H34]|uniref:ArsR/SmtB family transcription factor n=1 Tax=Huijunlia imazamoxiresistens TaxID=3127457 RepID=UPI0039C912A1
MKPAGELILNSRDLDKGDLALRALTNPSSRQILHYLHARGTARVTEVYQALSFRQSDASRHLGELRRAGLVTANHVGQCMYYALHYPKLQEMQRLAEILLQARPGKKEQEACIPCPSPLVPTKTRKRKIKPGTHCLSVPISRSGQTHPCILLTVNRPFHAFWNAP